MDPRDLNGTSGSGSHDYMPSSSGGSSEVGRAENQEARKASEAKPYSNRLTPAKIAQQTLEQSKNQPAAASSIKKGSASNSLGTAITAVARKIGNVINKITSPLASSTKLTSSHVTNGTNLPDNSNPVILAQKPWILADKRALLSQKESELSDSKSLGKPTGELRDEIQQLKNVIRDSENILLRSPNNEGKVLNELTKQLGKQKAVQSQFENDVWGMSKSVKEAKLITLNNGSSKFLEENNPQDPEVSTLITFVENQQKIEILELKIRLRTDTTLKNNDPKTIALEEKLAFLESSETTLQDLVSNYKEQNWTIQSSFATRAEASPKQILQEAYREAATEFLWLEASPNQKEKPVTLEGLKVNISEKAKYAVGGEGLNVDEVPVLSKYLNAAKELIKHTLEQRKEKHPDDAILQSRFNSFMEAYDATKHSEDNPDEFMAMLDFLNDDENEWAVEIGVYDDVSLEEEPLSDVDDELYPFNTSTAEERLSNESYSPRASSSPSISSSKSDPDDYIPYILRKDFKEVDSTVATGQPIEDSRPLYDESLLLSVEDILNGDESTYLARGLKVTFEELNDKMMELWGFLDIIYDLEEIIELPPDHPQFILTRDNAIQNYKVLQEELRALIDAVNFSGMASVDGIFRGKVGGKDGEVLVLSGDKANVKYLGEKATETEVSKMRKATIAGIGVREKFGILPAAKNAIAFSEKHADGAEVSAYGGDNAAELRQSVGTTLAKTRPRDESTQFQLLSGDTVTNLKRIQDGLKGERKAAAVNCANDTLYGSVWKTGGSQEEQVFRKSNLSALAEQFHELRGDKEHHIPILGAMYVKNATFMDPADMSKPGSERGSFEGDITFVAALDLSKSYIRKEVQAAADAAGIPFDDFVKYITKMKYAAALGSMLENGVTDVLMSLPGTGSFQNPLGMVQEVLQELLFDADSPFKDRFATVNFNVFGNAATASPGDRAVASMLRDELRVPVSDYIRSFNIEEVEQQVKDISEKHKEIVGSIAAHPMKVVAFYYAPLSNVAEAEKSNPTGFLGNFAPCKCEVFGNQFRCVEAAFQWKKYELASKPQAGDDNKMAQRREALANDPRMHKLISATGDEAFHLNRELERDYNGVFAPGWREGVRDDAMWEALSAKFMQNPEYNDMLASTGDAYLLEHNEKVGRDVYWSDNANGTGHNMLGKMLTAIRDGTPKPRSESAFQLASVNDDMILSAKLTAFNRQQNGNKDGLPYTIFAREPTQSGKQPAAKLADSEDLVSAPLDGKYVSKENDLVDFYRVEVLKLNDNIENKPVENRIRNLEVLAKALSDSAQLSGISTNEGKALIKLMQECENLIAKLK